MGIFRDFYEFLLLEPSKECSGVLEALLAILSPWAQHINAQS